MPTQIVENFRDFKDVKEEEIEEKNIEGFIQGLKYVNMRLEKLLNFNQNMHTEMLLAYTFTCNIIHKKLLEIREKKWTTYTKKAS